MGGPDVERGFKLGDNGQIEFSSLGEHKNLRLDKNDFFVSLKRALEKNVFKPEFKYDLTEKLASDR